jgi:hypothetical protein
LVDGFEHENHFNSEVHFWQRSVGSEMKNR